MYLKNLKLTNFRNYSSLNFKFETPITVLIGDNAQGKTNFLESIYFLATGKSNRADRDDELIKEGEEILRVEGEISSVIPENSLSRESSLLSSLRKRGSAQVMDPGSQVVRDDKKKQEEETTQLEIAMLLSQNSLRKKISVNGIPRRLVDYTSNLAVIFFRPEDINLVGGSPSLRRNHIDQIISQVSRDYKKNLSDYEKVIIRKNKLLFAIREGFSKPEELIFWSDQQIILGNLLTLKRDEYFNFINSEQKKFGDFKYQYLPSEVNLQKLKDYKEREILSANSLIGPHRDDFIFLLSSVIPESNASRESKAMDLSKFGSRGEQRTAVLDLKFAEVEFVQSKLDSRPVLLLDDIFSELDPAHRVHVINLTNEQQTIISSVEWDNVLAKALKLAKIVKVEKNKLLSL